MDLPIVPHNKVQQLTRPGHHMFATLYDDARLVHIEATHFPDGREFALKPLLHLIEDIFERAAPSVPGFVQQGSTQAQLDSMDDKAYQSGFFDTLDVLSFTINKVACEISCQCSGGGDAHATTLGIFKALSSYTWDAKVVLAMAAFAWNYGGFWLVAQHYQTNPLAKSVALLKQLPDILERAGTLKSKFEALSNLIKAMLDVSKCIIEFKELPAQYITTAVYWTIRSIVACSEQIKGLVGMGHEYVESTAESWELSSVAHRLDSLLTFLMTIDDRGILKQVQASHAPDGRELDVKPFLYIIEDIFQLSAPDIPGFDLESKHVKLDVLDDKDFESYYFDLFDLLSFTINRVSCEISCKCSGGGDAHATTLGIFNNLGSYAWDAKVVLAMAAFALSYGEYWVVAQLNPTNQLAKSVALLQPEILEHADTLKSKFEALSNLIKAMLEVTICIAEIKGIPSQYISPDTPEMVIATAHIPIAVYWTIRSILACSVQIMGLIDMGPERSQELASLEQEVNSKHAHLKNQLILCYKIIEEKRHIEALISLIEAAHIDNMKVVRALIYAKDDQLPLVIVEDSTKRGVSLDVLKGRSVLLLITDLDVSLDELMILQKMYRESRQHSTRTESQYEVVWMPVMDSTAQWTEEKQHKFEYVQGMVPWYSIHHPSTVDPAVIRYIEEFWNFNKKPILVVLDPQGKVVNTNALHMIWIWGNPAFPFTNAREEALWREEVWRLELLADSVDPAIPTWIDKKSLVCLYGGDDIEWIRKFTATAQAVAGDAGITLEMLYVGKGNPKEKVGKNITTIVSENLSHTLQDIRLIWFFWVRLESMWHSKKKQGKSAENDPILQEIKTMLSFDGSEHCWAVFCLGAENEMAKAKGDTIMKCLTDFEAWKKNAETDGFLPALIQCLETTSTIPKTVVCSKCNKPI